MPTRIIVRLAAVAVFALGLIGGQGGRVDAGGITITNLFNTGVNATSTPLASGIPDPHYSLYSYPTAVSPYPPVSPTAVSSGSTGPVGAYISAAANANWIGPGVSGTPDTYDMYGTYDYRTTFNISGTITSSTQIEINGLWNADNYGVKICSTVSTRGYLNSSTHRIHSFPLPSHSVFPTARFHCRRPTRWTSSSITNRLPPVSRP